MVILTNPAGQTSNRFFQHIHLDAFCKENNIPFYNSTIADYAKDYPALQPRVNAGIVAAVKLLKMSRMNRVLDFSFNDESKSEYYCSTIAAAKGVFLCEGWGFRNWGLTQKYRSYYQQVFVPNINRKALQYKWLTRDNENEKIIGMHIRRGDYKEFAGGKFYYNDQVYINSMQQLQQSIGGQCKFIVFTNDAGLNTELYKKEFNNILFSDNAVVADHFLMSKCDYLIGPPSTFSLWASYIGERPYYHIADKDVVITLDKFDISKG